MPAFEPSYVQRWLEQNKPNEFHGHESDCLNPKCDYEFNYNDKRALDEDGQLICPNCGYLNTAEKIYGGQPGGNTRAGLSLDDMGKIGERLVQHIGNLPGIGPVTESYAGLKKYPIDAIIGHHGVEIKTNHSQAQPRFKIGKRKERLEKILHCQQNGLKPGLLGVRLNFHNNNADLFFRPGFSDTFIGAPTMRHLGTYDFEHLNPFKHPDLVPKNLPAQDGQDVDDVPFGHSDLDDLFGPDITKEAALRLEPSDAVIREVPLSEPYRDDFGALVHEPMMPFYHYDGFLHGPNSDKKYRSGIEPGSRIFNAFSPDNQLIGSAHLIDNDFNKDDPNNPVEFSQLYVHPKWRHTDVGKTLAEHALSHFPGRPLTAELVNPRLQTFMKRYNDSLGFDTRFDYGDQFKKRDNDAYIPAMPVKRSKEGAASWDRNWFLPPSNPNALNQSDVPNLENTVGEQLRNVDPANIERQRSRQQLKKIFAPVIMTREQYENHPEKIEDIPGEGPMIFDNGVMKSVRIIDQDTPEEMTQMMRNADTQSDSPRVRQWLQNGGFTVDSYGLRDVPNMPPYIVALPHAERKIRPESLSISMLKNLAHEAQQYGAPFVGGWLNKMDDTFYLDISDGFTDLKTALEKAKEWGQKAIWDSINNQEIRVSYEENQWQEA